MTNLANCPAGTTETLVGAIITIIGYVIRRIEKKKLEKKIKKEAGIE